MLRAAREPDDAAIDFAKFRAQVDILRDAVPSVHRSLDIARIWFGLSLWPNLWMLVLWMMAAALWVGSAMPGARRSRFRPSFRSNALITALILIGPAIEDSASGKSVLEGTIMRTCLFVGVALYACGTVLLLERWRPERLPEVRPKPTSEERPA